MTRDDLTREWQREAELYAYLGYVSPRKQAPTTKTRRFDEPPAEGSHRRPGRRCPANHCCHPPNHHNPERNPTMTSDQAMRSLADEATRGPWRVWYDPDPTKLRDASVETAWCHGDIEGDTELITDYLPTDADADAEFIAACREWVPDALRRIEAVREIHQPTRSIRFGHPCTTCTECLAIYPCHTVRILQGDNQ